ncbi:MAG: hypothetical protein CHACPFDD_01304 [Phycisphaerae bacterium]|nr:hypothetical protein [Phycisphaerae bacterium]
MTLELLPMFAGGLLGSSHCLGMCGGFAASLGALRPAWRALLPSQLIYAAGRVFTYSVLGLIAGGAAARLALLDLPLVGAQRAFSITTGLIMLLAGLATVGAFPRRAVGAVTDLFAPFFRHMLGLRGTGGLFVAGVFNGLLPCGLVYAFLALAVNASTPLHAGLRMLAFGLGTVPAMVLIGCGAHVVTPSARATANRVAAALVIVMGLVTIYRGLPLGAQHCHTAASTEAACCEHK